VHNAISAVLLPTFTIREISNEAPARLFRTFRCSPSVYGIITPRMMFELARQLMEIPSLTGGEKDVGLFLAAQLSRRGYRVEKQLLIPNRFNVLAFAGKPRVILCTHIDTVPPILPVREDENFLYGRGACDTKGIIAAMLVAGDRLRQDGIDSFGYLFVVGEEQKGDGAKAANKLKWESEYVVVGEPTGNKMAVAQKGTLLVDFAVTGRAAHSGYPQEGVSAIEGLWKVLQDCAAADWGNDKVLGEGTFNIGTFNGGAACNVVPATASASVMIRLVEPRAVAEERIQNIVGDRAETTIVSGSNPYAMHVVEGFETMVASFGSDVPYLQNLGKPLLIGPGSILDAHTANEKISKQEMMEGAAIYERLVTKLVS
jgi:acetylornithine deacetylase